MVTFMVAVVDSLNGSRAADCLLRDPELVTGLKVLEALKKGDVYMCRSE
jgi:hypothetical protein